MADRWASSNRRARLPKDWPRIRARILERDGHQCTWIEGRTRCVAVATDVDHIRNNDDHRDSNLQSLCGPHHRIKSSREGVAARHAYPRKRSSEQHPGVLHPEGGGSPPRPST